MISLHSRPPRCHLHRHLSYRSAFRSLHQCWYSTAWSCPFSVASILVLVGRPESQRSIMHARLMDLGQDLLELYAIRSTPVMARALAEERSRLVLMEAIMWTLWNLANRTLAEDGLTPANSHNVSKRQLQYIPVIKPLSLPFEVEVTTSHCVNPPRPIYAKPFVSVLPRMPCFLSRTHGGNTDCIFSG
jgi:hypothetical protein